MRIKKMKKALAVLLAIAMVFSMTALTYGAENDGSQGAAEPAEKVQSVETPAAEPAAEAAQPAQEQQADPAPASEAPAAEAPAAETPAAQAPAAEVPAVETPAAETPNTEPEAPKAEESAQAEPGKEAAGEETEADEPKDEKKDDKEDKDDKDEKYPAVTLTGAASGVNVTLTAPEGAFPEGVKLSVSPAGSAAVINAVENAMENSGREMTDVVAIDVTPLDKDGKEIQPKRPVTVSFSGTGLDVETGGSVNVYRVSDDASSVTPMPTAAANPNAQTFSTDHFTIYAAGSSVPGDEQGTGASANNRYLVAWHDVITFTSSRSGGVWVAIGGSGYNFNAATRKLTNNNNSTSDQEVVITHTGFGYIEYFYVTCLRQKFTVNFWLQDVGETEPGKQSSVDVYNGDRIPADSIPAYPDEKEGCKLYKWYTDSTWSELANMTARITPNANKDFYAKYAGEATIQYKKNCNSAVTMPEDLTDGIGNRVTLATDATRTGYTLVSWNTKSDFSGDSYQLGESVVMPENGMVLYAEWEKTNNLTMTYVYNYLPDHVNTVWNSVSGLQPNSRTRLLSGCPTRPGYFFLGWSQFRIGGPQYYPDTTFATGTSNIVLYAIWGELRTEDLDIQQLTAYGEERIYDGAKHEIESVKEAEDETLLMDRFLHVGSYTPWYTVFTHEIYVDLQGVEASGTDVGSYSTPLAAELWDLSPLGVLTALDQYIEITNTKLVIKPVEVTVSTDSDDKLHDGEPLTAGGSLKYLGQDGSHEVTFAAAGEAVELVNGETLNIRTTGEQTEVGQSDNPYEVDWGKPDDWGDVASTADEHNYKFTGKDSIGKLTVYYRVDFEGNAPEGEEVKDVPDPIKAYEPAEEPEAELPKDGPTAGHYTFVGWATDPEATEAEYEAGATVKPNGENTKDGVMTLYAVWKIKEYDITFDPAGGTIDGKTDPKVIKCEYNTEIEIIDAPVRDGYDFIEWQGSSYQPGDKYTVEGDHTFTAKWEKTSEQEEKNKEQNTGRPDKDKKKGKKGSKAENGEEATTDENQTGDTRQMAGWILLLSYSIIAIIALTSRRRRNNWSH